MGAVGLITRMSRIMNVCCESFACQKPLRAENEGILIFTLHWKISNWLFKRLKEHETQKSATHDEKHLYNTVMDLSLHAFQAVGSKTKLCLKV